MDFLDWFHHATVYGLDVRNLAYAAGASAVFYAAVHAALVFARSRWQRFAARSANQVDDLLIEVFSATSRWLLLVASLLVGLGFLDLSDRWHARVSQLWFVAVALQVGLWLTRAVAVGQRHYQARHALNGEVRVTASATLVSWFVRTVLWSTVLLAMLANMGVNITAFIASLGVGGIAIALAVQNVLGDLFASVAIAVDKPFEVGDGIGFGDVAGTVEYIGVKTTRLRAASGEQVVIGNTDLLKQVVRNYKRMTERRIAVTLGLAYGATPEQLMQVPGLVRAAVESHPELRFDRAHFRGFGESSLDFELVYFVRSPDYLVYMDKQQELNLRLMRDLAVLGVDFAFPTRTVVLARAASPQDERTVVAAAG